MSQAVRFVDAQPSQRAVVALKQGPVGLHCGIFFRASDEALRILHLAFHYQLAVDHSFDGWAYVAPQIDPIELGVLAGFCSLLNSVQPGIPYGFEYQASKFDDEGRFVPGPGESGLTCTTFVLAVFKWARLALLIPETWQSRTEDVEAQRRLIVFLQRAASPQHVAAVEAEVGCMRFRSEEAAAATAMTPRPVGFPEASAAGVQVRASFESCMTTRSNGATR
ncbi:MAG: hypothetical protein E6J90_15705 [Deltaproteobacteria bacterium]|nr:MAG: hypothetical protein E6J91_19880 [Deltaproteobacteria bacterium]TMQ20809.1 MAG: hypothetical protein E6J90_15705 [Deltaproteobacteria bacterium]